MRRHSYTYVRARLRRFLDDEDTTRWTDAEMKEALNRAIADSYPHWFDIEVEDGLQTVSPNQYEYQLREWMYDILAVTLEQGSNEPYARLQDWEALAGVLFLPQRRNRYVAGKRLRIYYTTPPRPFRDISGSDGAVSSGDETTFTSTGSTFVTDEVQVGDLLTVTTNDEVVIVTKVVSETKLEVNAPLTVGTNLSFYINRYTTVPLTFLLHRAAYYLYLRDGQGGAGRDVTECMTWAKFHWDMSEYLLNRLTRSKPAKLSGL